MTNTGMQAQIQITVLVELVADLVDSAASLVAASVVLKISSTLSLEEAVGQSIQMRLVKVLICNIRSTCLLKKRFWCRKEIKYNREEICHTCGGNGAKPGTQPTTCHKCHGAGTINVERQTPLGRVMSRQTCDVCHGTGKEIKEPCPTCHGSGHEKKAHSVKVNVPAGVEEGQQMRLAGQGEAGENGGPFGDLYVVFRVEESDIFDREGSEIYYELPLSFVQAALGDEVQVPTVHGDVKLKIPAGTQTGTNFRLRGKGAPKLRGGATGDQHVKVKLITPKNLNEQQREALRAFAEAGGIKVEEQQEDGFFDKFKDAFGGKKRK